MEFVEELVGGKVQSGKRFFFENKQGKREGNSLGDKIFREKLVTIL